MTLALRKFFDEHPNLATSLTARVMEILLENRHEAAEALKFLKGTRTQKENHRLINDIIRIDLVEFLRHDDDIENNESTGRSLSYELFIGSRREKEYVEEFYDRNGFVIATHFEDECVILSEDVSVESGELINNDKAYQVTYLHKVKERCVSSWELDGTPFGYFIHTSTYRTTEITWRDGNPAERPPKLPELFVEYDWDNRCPFFSGPMGRVTSDWGWRQEPLGIDDFHPGMDVGVPVGTPVFATHSGRVRFTRPDAGDGNSGVWIENGSNLYIYWHVAPSVTDGQSVTVGQQIGVTGNYSRPHLHYARYNTPPGWSGNPKKSWSVDPCP